MLTITSIMVRIFSHYIPGRVLFLVGLEAMVLLLSLYIGVSLWLLNPGSAFSGMDDPLLPKAAGFAFLMITSMTALGLYQAEVKEDVKGILLRLVTAFLLGLAVLSLVFYLAPSLYLGYGVLFVALVVALAGSIFTRVLFIKWVDLGAFKRRILILGSGSRALKAAEVAQRNHILVGFLPLQAASCAVDASLVLPQEGSLLNAAEKYGVSEIVIALRDRRGGLPVQELLECKLKGIRVTDLSAFFEREGGQLRLDSLNASWLVLGEGFRQNFLRNIVKRLFDLTASAALLVVTFPVMLLTALCIFLEDGAPVFYRQERVGQGGRTFNVLKFRSMRKDAEKDGTPRWAAANDDRTTRVGRFIRKVRIDELPQIFNVFKGEMSFVGPRPERPFFVNQLAGQIPYYNARHSIKPGITGWAQVRYAYGASLDDAVEKLQYDLYYVKNHSLFLDLMILIDTVQVVLWGKGAR